MPPSTVTTDLPPITCHVTRWYFWRVAKFAALFLFAGLWFGYDALVGYPNENVIAEKHDWFQNEVHASYAEMEAAGTLDQWPALAERNGWPLEKNGEAPTWVTYAATHGWPEKPPHPHSDAAISTQSYIALAGIVFALIALGIGYLNRNKSLSAGSESLKTPSGIRIPFSAVNEIDLRPWRTKGFARLTYKNAGGHSAKTTIDDLKYGGAAAVLQRLEAHFEGVIIEEISPGEEESSSGEKKSDPASSVATEQAV